MVEALTLAVALIVGLDPALVEIVGLSLGAYSLTTAVLAGLGRALAEVGAILIVGGNIAGVTRTMTTAISLETSRGDLPLALGLGVILFTLTLIINATAHLVAQAA